MGEATLLRVIEYQNPGLLEMVRGQLTVPSPLDRSRLMKVYQYTNIIHNSHDPSYNLIVFLACGLKMFSPESLLADCKVRNGVCAEMADVAGVTRRDATYYISTYVRHYFEKRKGFADMVEQIVERFG